MAVAPLRIFFGTVMPQSVRRLSVSIALVVAALAGCARELPRPVILAASTTASPEQLR